MSSLNGAINGIPLLICAWLGFNSQETTHSIIYNIKVGMRISLYKNGRRTSQSIMKVSYSLNFFIFLATVLNLNSNIRKFRSIKIKRNKSESKFWGLWNYKSSANRENLKKWWEGVGSKRWIRRDRFPRQRIFTRNILDSASDRQSSCIMKSGCGASDGIPTILFFLVHAVVRQWKLLSSQS